MRNQARLSGKAGTTETWFTRFVNFYRTLFLMHCLLDFNPISLIVCLSSSAGCIKDSGTFFILICRKSPEAYWVLTGSSTVDRLGPGRFSFPVSQLKYDEKRLQNFGVILRYHAFVHLPSASPGNETEEECPYRSGAPL